jgi:hypothetical protein
MYDPPQNKTFSRYRWIRTTSSYDFPGKISFVLKTGNSTTTGCSYGLHTATTPFFVQIGDEDQSRSDRGYRTDDGQSNILMYLRQISCREMLLTNQI